MSGAGSASVVAADVAVLVVLRPQPRRLVALAADPSAALARLGTDRAAALVVSAGLWSAAAWVAVGLLATLGTRLPGLLGRCCAVVSTVALPAALRRVVMGSIGLGLLAGPTTAALAAPVHAVQIAAAHRAGPITGQPGPSWPTSPPATPSASRPSGSAPPMTPTHSRPTRSRPAGSAPTAHPQHERHHRTDHGDTVRVHAGDSLWLIAARRLGGQPPPAHVAAYWPQLYRANRALVGPDPALLSPGQVLRLPDPGTS